MLFGSLFILPSSGQFGRRKERIFSNASLSVEDLLHKVFVRTAKQVSSTKSETYKLGTRGKIVYFVL